MPSRHLIEKTLWWRVCASITAHSRTPHKLIEDRDNADRDRCDL